ncbi:golgin subfamily A member 6-like protein 4 [Pristis pectinata]|uniref:golgin subfamily A member 6-like protein 4 n=1 Tax=Pristis pectinata TaxID=685728 RepID=UPI00223DC205|nr:golgin subfamily A member 6-like protein 4 [Pristis pectinata]
MRSGAIPSFTQCISLVLALILFALGWTLFLGQPEAAEMQQETGRLREENGRLREENGRLREENGRLREGSGMLQERLQKCEARALDLGAEITRRSKTQESEMSLQKQVIAQEKSIKELQDQNRVLNSKMTELQGYLQHCKEAKELQGNEIHECMKTNENLRKNQQQIHYLRSRTSDLEFALDNCRSNSCKEQEHSILWYILPFVLGLFLGCCSKCIDWS